MAETRETSAHPAPPCDSPADADGSSQPGLADLGILLVHGIGEQAQGETLTKFAEPIVDWMRDWLHRGSAQGSLVASTPVDAALRPPLLATDTPAHARVVIGAAREDATDEAVAQEWLFAEAWWGPQVLTPPIGSFTLWLITRGPWLMLFHFNQRLLASRDLHNGWKWLIGIPLSVVWVVLSLLLSVVLIAASLLALIPIGRVRRAVFAVLRRIAGVVGDAYGQLRSPIQRAAFERAVLEALKWLRPKCQRLAVIAHSQGAAIAHGALRGGEPKADLLVTVGAGITKLEALRYLERLGPSDRIAAFLAPLTLVAAAVVTLRTRALGLAEAEARFVLPVTLGIVGVALLAQVWITVRRSLRHLRDRSKQLSLAQAQPNLRWLDIVGTHDPVPAGELVQFFDLPTIESQPIPILRSWFADHTSYWTARLSFMQVLVPRLADCARLPAIVKNDAAAAGRLAEAQRRLDVDLRALSAARWLDLLALAVPFVVAPDRLIAGVDRLRVLLAGRATPDAPGGQAAPLRFIEEAIANVEQAVRWTAEVIAGSQATWARSAVNLAVALLLISLALLAWRRLEFAVWGAWSAGRNERALRGPASLRGLPEPTQIETWLFAALSTTVINMAMATTLLMALAVSAAWSFAPAWVTEAGVYNLLGQTAAALLAALMLFSQIAERAKEFVSLRERWRRWRATHTQVTWPNLRAVLSRIIEVALGLLVAWLVIDQLLTLPAFLRPEIIFIGVLAVLRGLLALLDGIWQRLDSARAKVRTKVILLTSPIVVGAMAVTGLAFVPRTEPLQAAMIVSGVAVVGCIAAGIIMLALHVTRTAS
jgi:hypothetical protein